jgi:hypothetical protein
MKLKLPRRRTRLIILGAIILIGSLYPFETTIVPAWKIRVVDEDGVAYPGTRVVEYWKHYSLELDDGMNGEERHTDANGEVHFPRRTIRVSLAGRVFRMTITLISSLMHGSTGIRASVMANGPRGSTDVRYVVDQPPPDTLVLPRREEP